MRVLVEMLRLTYLILAGVFFLCCQQMDLGVELTNNLCNDDFSRPDAPGFGRNWELGASIPRPISADLRIDNNRGRVTIPSGGPFVEAHCKYRIEKRKARTSVTFTVPPGAPTITGHSIFLFRSESQVYMCGARLNSFDLARTSNDVTTSLTSGSNFGTTFTPGSTLRLTLEAEENKLTCYINLNGVQETLVTHNYTSSGAGTGVFLFGGAPGLDLHLDDFSVEGYE